MNESLIRKRPIYALLQFTAPMIFGNIFQQMYGMADSVIVGRYIGEQALAAIGVSSALTHIFICFAMGGGVGASVIVGRYFDKV